MRVLSGATAGTAARTSAAREARPPEYVDLRAAAGQLEFWAMLIRGWRVTAAGVNALCGAMLPVALRTARCGAAVRARLRGSCPGRTPHPAAPSASSRNAAPGAPAAVSGAAPATAARAVFDGLPAAPVRPAASAAPRARVGAACRRREDRDLPGRRRPAARGARSTASRSRSRARPCRQSRTVIESAVAICGSNSPSGPGQAGARRAPRRVR